jgi:Methyltransferase domain
MDNLKLDLGCGSCKKDGTIGVDFVSAPGVDYVLDMTKEKLPFSEQSVQSVFSSHFFEHIENPVPIYQELSRVCVDKAELEFWTPYGWSNPAFIFGHETFFNEDHYLHLCYWFADHWKAILNANWLLKEIVYVVEHKTLIDLYDNNVALDFALKYHKNIVQEFGVFLEVRHDYVGSLEPPKRSVATNRFAKRHLINSNQSSTYSDPVPHEELIDLLLTDHRSPLEISPVKQDQFQVDMQELQAIQERLINAESMINAMESSKFWKLRKLWFGFKKRFGLPIV